MAKVKEVASETYTKEEITRSQKYAEMQDFLSFVLKEDKSYTLDEIDALIKDFSEREVK